MYSSDWWSNPRNERFHRRWLGKDRTSSEEANSEENIPRKNIDRRAEETHRWAKWPTNAVHRWTDDEKDTNWRSTVDSSRLCAVRNERRWPNRKRFEKIKSTRRPNSERAKRRATRREFRSRRLTSSSDGRERKRIGVKDQFSLSRSHSICTKILTTFEIIDIPPRLFIRYLTDFSLALSLSRTMNIN